MVAKKTALGCEEGGQGPLFPCHWFYFIAQLILFIRFHI